MTFQYILDKDRAAAIGQVDKGTRFELLMQAYLRTDPTYADRFQNTWLGNEFPQREQLSGHDTGIDLEARTEEGQYGAVQCKCYAEDAVIDKGAVDSFLSTSSRTFTDTNGRTVGFAGV